MILHWEKDWVSGLEGHLYNTHRLVYSNSWKLLVFDNLLLDHVELPHNLDLAVHLVHIIGWMGKGDHPKTFLPLALFY